MNRCVAWCLSGLVACGVVLAGSPRPALAIPPFKKEFDAKYVKKDGTDVEKEFAAKAEKVKCNTCHKGKTKKERNAYGDALAELLDKKADEKDLKKIQESLDKVAGMKSKADDPSSPTFGELIQQGKLPGGEEDLK